LLLVEQIRRLAACSQRLAAHEGNSLKKAFTGFSLLMTFCLAGCGYHAANWNSGPYASAGKTMNIPIFVNRTYKPNLEGVLANALIDEFAGKSGLTVQSCQGDLTLSGEVVAYGLSAVAYSSSDTVKEYSSNMSISATLRKNSNQQVLWKGSLSWSQSFPANSDIALQQNAEDEAIREICARLAQQMYVNVIQDF
jgi:outer membrane lipopolysaccharide assembly protein LptE/RlpB